MCLYVVLLNKNSMHRTLQSILFNNKIHYTFVLFIHHPTNSLIKIIVGIYVHVNSVKIIKYIIVHFMLIFI